VVLARRDARNRLSFTYLHTNLSRDDFTAWQVGQLCRLRWQIELLFKEWKSYGNLHRFDTSNAPLAKDLSTHRVAASARHYLDAILKALLVPGLSLLQSLREAFAFMRDNARRASCA
jgi:Transposase DDE domain